MSFFAECFKGHMPVFVLGIITQVLYNLLAVLFFTGEFEVNPISKRFTCCAHSHVEVRAFLNKTALTVAYVIIGWPRIQTAVTMLLTFLLAWQFFKWVSGLGAPGFPCSTPLNTPLHTCHQNMHSTARWTTVYMSI